MGIHTGKIVRGLRRSPEEWLAGKQGLHSVFLPSTCASAGNSVSNVLATDNSGRKELAAARNL